MILFLFWTKGTDLGDITSSYDLNRNISLSCTLGQNGIAYFKKYGEVTKANDTNIFYYNIPK